MSMPRRFTPSRAALVHSSARAGDPKRTKNPSPRRVDLGAFAPQDFGAHGIVMLLEHNPPAAIAQRWGMLGGTDDVGQEQRGENALHPEHRPFLTLRRMDEP
jgi:hypothetical protein